MIEFTLPSLYDAELPRVTPVTVQVAQSVMTVPMLGLTVICPLNVSVSAPSVHPVPEASLKSNLFVAPVFDHVAVEPEVGASDTDQPLGVLALGFITYNLWLLFPSVPVDELPAFWQSNEKLLVAIAILGLATAMREASRISTLNVPALITCVTSEAGAAEEVPLNKPILTVSAAIK